MGILLTDASIQHAFEWLEIQALWADISAARGASEFYAIEQSGTPGLSLPKMKRSKGPALICI
jgi:hypothetical protein